MSNIWTNDYNPFQKFKVLAWYDRMEQIKNGFFPAPVNIALDMCQGTTTKKLCGKFHCDFCMSDFDDDSEICYIPKDVLLSLPKFYSEWGVKSLCLAGNSSDPSMYPHDTQIEFLRLCHEYGIDIGYVSNGAYYTEKLIEAVAMYCNWSGWSVNAGNEESHAEITGTNTFDKIIKSIEQMSEVITSKKLVHNIGYKFLITDNNYKTIYTGIELASKIGVRHFQIRPCELPEWRTKAIDTESVEQQIVRGIEDFERPGEFEIFGVREKFNPDFSKIPMKKCYDVSGLGSTWKADGDVVICPDRRWSPEFRLGNFITDGLEGIKAKWEGPEHREMIDEINGDLDKCIRCTSKHWHDIYENCVLKDGLDVTLI